MFNSEAGAANPIFVLKLAPIKSKPESVSVVTVLQVPALSPPSN